MLRRIGYNGSSRKNTNQLPKKTESFLITSIVISMAIITTCIHRSHFHAQTVKKSWLSTPRTSWLSTLRTSRTMAAPSNVRLTVTAKLPLNNQYMICCVCNCVQIPPHVGVGKIPFCLNQGPPAKCSYCCGCVICQRAADTRRAMRPSCNCVDCTPAPAARARATWPTDATLPAFRLSTEYLWWPTEYPFLSQGIGLRQRMAAADAVGRRGVSWRQRMAQNEEATYELRQHAPEYMHGHCVFLAHAWSHRILHLCFVAWSHKE